MPTKGFDCCGFDIFAIADDGTWHRIDMSQTVTLSVDDTDENAWSINTNGMSCTLETKITRGMMKLFYPWRDIKRRIRKMEKERRKRLKEMTGG